MEFMPMMASTTKTIASAAVQPGFVLPKTKTLVYFKPAPKTLDTMPVAPTPTEVSPGSGEMSVEDMMKLVAASQPSQESAASEIPWKWIGIGAVVLAAVVLMKKK